MIDLLIFLGLVLAITIAVAFGICVIASALTAEVSDEIERRKEDL